MNIPSNLRANYNIIAKIQDGQFLIRKVGYNSSKANVVYEKTLTSNASEINVTDLDMDADGGEYEFTLFHSGTTAGDIFIQFNGITSGYHETIMAVYGTNSANNTSLPFNGSYQQAGTYIEGWLHSSPLQEFPARLDGKFYLIENPFKKTIGYEMQNKVSVSGKQIYSLVTGVNSGNIENLTSLRFYRQSGSYLAGTKLIIKKIN